MFLILGWLHSNKLNYPKPYGSPCSALCLQPPAKHWLLSWRWNWCSAGPSSRLKWQIRGRHHHYITAGSFPGRTRNEGRLLYLARGNDFPKIRIMMWDHRRWYLVICLGFCFCIMHIVVHFRKNFVFCCEMNLRLALIILRCASLFSGLYFILRQQTSGHSSLIIQNSACFLNKC